MSCVKENFALSFPKYECDDRSEVNESRRESRRTDGKFVKDFIVDL